MTAKEKANKLYMRFIQFVPAEEEFEHNHAKQCALICVEEILEATKEEIDRPDTVLKTVYSSYWQSVKTEIEKL